MTSAVTGGGLVLMILNFDFTEKTDDVNITFRDIHSSSGNCQ